MPILIEGGKGKSKKPTTEVLNNLGLNSGTQTKSTTPAGSSTEAVKKPQAPQGAAPVLQIPTPVTPKVGSAPANNTAAGPIGALIGGLLERAVNIEDLFFDTGKLKTDKAAAQKAVKDTVNKVLGPTPVETPQDDFLQVTQTFVPSTTPAPAPSSTSAPPVDDFLSIPQTYKPPTATVTTSQTAPTGTTMPTTPVTPASPAANAPKPSTPSMSTVPSAETNTVSSQLEKKSEEDYAAWLASLKPGANVAKPVTTPAPSTTTAPKSAGEALANAGAVVNAIPTLSSGAVSAVTPTTTTTEAPKPGGGGGGGGQPPTQTTTPVAPPITAPPTQTTPPSTSPPTGQVPPTTGGGNTLPPINLGTVVSPLPAGSVNVPNYLQFQPPQAGSVMERGQMPVVPNLTAGNLNDALAELGIGDPTLPTAPNRQAGNFRDYLGQNGAETMTEAQLAETAKRLAEIQINPELSQAEQDRQALAARYALALSQAGQGKEAALSGMEKGFNDRLKQIQALALRNNLASSNIPLQEDINPLVNDYNIQRRGVEESIANKIAQLSLEASLGDQDAAKRIQTLLGQRGALEAQGLFDLRNQEREFGELSRSNRFNEFQGQENINRQAAQDTFGNQAALAQLQEMLRGNRADEFFQQQELDQNTAQQNFANQAALAQLQEAMRQSDIGNNRADRSQYIQEWAAQNGLITEAARLQDSLLNSNLSRRQGELDLAQESDQNSLRNRYLQAQIAQMLSSAARGGVDPLDAADVSNEVAANVIAIQRAVKNGEMTNDQASRMYAAFAQQYDAANGSGAWNRDYGALFGQATAGGSAGAQVPSTPNSFWEALQEALKNTSLYF